MVITSNMKAKETNMIYMINDHKTRKEWKILLTMQINFISSKDSGETHTMHTKSNNIEIMMGNETVEIVEKLFESPLQNYQKDLEESMRKREFDLLHYQLQKISLKRSESYIDSPAWMKNKKATINLKNNDDNCFQYALTVALNYPNIKKDFPSHSKDWKKFEQKNKIIALNILFVPHNTEKIRLAYKTKHNFKRENQVILLMTTDGKKWCYLTVKSLSALLRIQKISLIITEARQRLYGKVLQRLNKARNGNS